MGLSIAQAASKTGLTPHTLRYYEKEGLLPTVTRKPSGIRDFQENDFEWLEVIACLKQTGMPVKDIKEFIGWCKEGDSTLEKRLAFFKEQKKKAERQMAEFKKHMEKIDYKIRYYSAAVEAGTEKNNQNGCAPR